MSQLFLSMCWNPEEVGSVPVKEGTSSARVKEVSRHREGFLLPLLSLLYRLPPEGLAQLKVCLPLKIWT